MEFLRAFFKTEMDLISFLSWMMVLSGAATAIALLVGFKATYGRYGSESSLAKISLPARWAWFIQEAPSLAFPLYFLLASGSQGAGFLSSNTIVLLMFTAHYLQRTLIFPFLIKGGKPTPVHLVMMAFAFCCWNGYIQSAYHQLYASYDSNHLTKLTSIAGILLFIFGMTVNIQSDEILRNLRKPGETAYKIPRGGMFEYVSGANFLGEIVEWFGYALFAQSLPAFAFAFFTAANIGPRALHHHKWYQEKFDNYPKSRKALIPYIL
uniref:3-oxo-5alpha-steroid 4-dehydrogenase (NADP(+)) n=1 Tax=Plectus sambesii TaxID=2011161 RepID=A0A914XDB7_9BILA